MAYEAVMHEMAERLFSLDVNPVAYPLVFLAGLLTNFCPCNVAFMPIVLGGAGGFSFGRERRRALLYSAVFSAGIVTTFCALGALAALAGTALLGLRTACLVFVAAAAFAMGVYCLGVVTFKMPGKLGLAAGTRKGLGGAFALGLAAGAVSSPCTTPVLAVILTYVAAQARLAYGVSLLLTYASGFVVPLLLVGACADFILRMRRWDERTHYRVWVARGSGVLLIAFGVYVVFQVW
jgi:cytochrome c-type biogenesis protein